tara:strand:+ start:8372 stop:8701 length:330 start_codon:yes stop_codon:yes gene_type:complete
MNILIDIDGTVSEDIPNEESHRFSTAYVIKDAVNAVNDLYNRKHTITFFTARTEEHRDVTETWLHNNGFDYHNIIFGKPRGGNYVWIDNLDVRGIKYNNNWNQIIKLYP